ncbi:hypothetical protein OPQ81_006045 [Rhizoctonia solani]|nr:hypothetical protein OPQ81_006045 [Rhizoctonia solani]
MLLRSETEQQSSCTSNPIEIPHISSQDDPHQKQDDHSGTMIGVPPSIDQTETQQSQPSTREIETAYQASAGYSQSQSQHPGSDMPRLDNANFVVSHPMPSHAQPYFESSTILSSQSTPLAHQQQVHSDLIPGTRGDTSGSYLVNATDSHGSPGSGLNGQPGPDLGWFLPTSSGLVHAPTQSVGNDLGSPGPLAKRQREEGSDESDCGDKALQKVLTEQPHQTQPPKRLSGACTHCKRLKMRCIFEEGATTCQRCNHTNRPCVIEIRRRGPPISRGVIMMREIQMKQQIIDSLLELVGLIIFLQIRQGANLFYGCKIPK